MIPATAEAVASNEASAEHSDRSLLLNTAIGLMAFLTLVDLFGAQAILPTLARHYGVSASEMGVATNACTLGMALASLAVASFSMRIRRRTGIVASLLVLAVPTALLAHAPNLAVFAALRVAQGLCMAAAFALTLAYLGERFRPGDVAAASAAYIAGNVASNLVGRLASASVADHFGLSWSFYAFAAANVAGALLAWLTIRGGPVAVTRAAVTTEGADRARSFDPGVAAACGIGFFILFAFIGTFTYVNFVLMRAPLALSQMQLGLVYLIFLPSLVTTTQAGAIAARLGTRRALILSLAPACLALPLLLAQTLALVLAGLTLVALGTFFAQATATGYVSRTMSLDRGTASGLYLASYFIGGLAGAYILGRLFDVFGWGACVVGIATALLAAVMLATRLKH